LIPRGACDRKPFIATDLEGDAVQQALLIRRQLQDGALEETEADEVDGVELDGNCLRFLADLAAGL